MERVWEGLGAFDEDSDEEGKIEYEKLVPGAGIESSIILDWA